MIESSSEQFTCTACGACCRNFGDGQHVVLLWADIQILSQWIGVSFNYFLEEYVDFIDLDVYRVPVLRHYDRVCHFLSEGGHCTVWPAKPLLCSIAPQYFMPQHNLHLDCMRDVKYSVGHELEELFFAAVIQDRKEASLAAQGTVPIAEIEKRLKAARLENTRDQIGHSEEDEAPAHAPDKGDLSGLDRENH